MTVRALRSHSLRRQLVKAAPRLVFDVSTRCSAIRHTRLTSDWPRFDSTDLISDFINLTSVSPSATVDMNASLDVYSSFQALDRFDTQWTTWAEEAASPFATLLWLKAWWRAFGEGEPTCIVLRALDGSLRAGGCFQRRRGRLVGMANDHSGSWDLVAATEPDRVAFYSALARTERQSLVFPLLPSQDAAEAARAAVRRSSYRVATECRRMSPYIELPSTFDALLASRSRNLRSQFRRRRLALGRAGQWVLRTAREPDDVTAYLEPFLKIEGSGWKTKRRTSILLDRRANVFYRTLATLAASSGMLRLRLLELDGVAIAGDFSLCFGGGEFLLKSGYNTDYATFSPGLVLRGEAIRAAIGDGLRFVDLLGSADPWKLRWTDQLRPRISLRAYRGPFAVPKVLYRTYARPALSTSIPARRLRGNH